MERPSNLKALYAVILLMSMAWFGCDMLQKEEIPPDKLPPIPEKCAALSTQYTHALQVAYTSAEASQLQIARLANIFVECMEGEGLSRAEAKGIIKNLEKTTKENLNKGGGQEGYIYR
jgi:hypothetical protein